MSCGVGHRCGSDPAWLWPWCRPAAVAPIGPLAWETSYAAGAAVKRQKKKKMSFDYLSAVLVSSLEVTPDMSFWWALLDLGGQCVRVSSEILYA